MESNVAQKMREALERTNKWISRLLESGNDDSDYRMIMGELAKCKEINQSAITIPLRNCDVGSAEEQTERYDVFCIRNNNGGNCSGCPLSSRETWSCQLKWAQMPYEADAKNEGDAE